MKTFEQLTTQEFQAILLDIYIKGIDSENIGVREFILHIKKSILSSINSNHLINVNQGSETIHRKNLVKL